MKTNDDRQHLKLLSIFHYVMGGTITFFTFISVFQIIGGILILDPSQSFPPELPEISSPQSFKLIIYYSIIFNIIYSILGLILAAATIMSGRFIRLRRRYWFSFALACILCTIIPFGTVLG
nr:hypothetical protein [Prochloraceae cyanobacterium]